MGWKEALVTPLGFLLRKKRAGEEMSIQYYKELKTDRLFSLFSRSFSSGKERLHAGLGLIFILFARSLGKTKLFLELAHDNK
jgi:hypothetical protein